MSSNSSSLAYLAPTMNLDQPLDSGSRDKAPTLDAGGRRFSWAIILSVFLIIWFIVAVILYVWSPNWLHKRDPAGNVTSSIDTVTLLIVSLITALFITFIAYIIYLLIVNNSGKKSM